MSSVLAVISEWHIVLVLIIVFLLFGGRKLPELARGIGEAMKEFKKASRDVHDDQPNPPQKPESTPPVSSPQDKQPTKPS